MLSKEEYINLFLSLKTSNDINSIKKSNLWENIKNDIEIYSLFEVRAYYIYLKEKGKI